MIQIKHELLNIKYHNRNQFDCGVSDLNNYLQRIANQDQKNNLSRIYVLAEQTEIIGYYSICAHAVPSDNMPQSIKTASYSSAPFLLLGRLAVNLKFQKQGYGDALIFDAFQKTAETAEKVGVLGMIVDAKDKQAIEFYRKFGFQPLSVSHNRLVLPLSALSSLIR